MATDTEKKLATILLKERLERLTGKKVILKEEIDIKTTFAFDSEHDLEIKNILDSNGFQYKVSSINGVNYYELNSPEEFQRAIPVLQDQIKNK